MADPIKPKPSGKENILTKKYGKLKGWQLLGIVAVGGALVLYVIKSRQAAGTQANVATGDFSGTVPDQNATLPGVDGTGLQAAIDQAGDLSSSNAETVGQQGQQIASLQEQVKKAQHAADVANNKVNHMPTLAAIQQNLRNHAPGAAKKKPAAKKPPAKKAVKPAPKKKAPAKKAAPKKITPGISPLVVRAKVA